MRYYSCCYDLKIQRRRMYGRALLLLVALVTSQIFQGVRSLQIKAMLQKAFQIRGRNYYFVERSGTTNNKNSTTTRNNSIASTSETSISDSSMNYSPDVLAQKLGVQPIANTAKIVWKLAFEIQRKTLPLLHLLDPFKPQNLDLCLCCLWWKARSASSDPSNNPVLYDEFLSYDMLPSATRLIILPSLPFSNLLFPRLHHANVELRTAYINQAISKQIETIQKANNNNVRIRMISFGAGYDVRSIRLRSTNMIDEAYELDRPEVISSKQNMMDRLLIRRRQRKKNRPHKFIDVAAHHLPTLIGIDLNDTNNNRIPMVLRDILLGTTTTTTTQSNNSTPQCHTIFLFEGVMIYLNKGVPTELLRICSQAVSSLPSSASASLVFADRLENIDSADTSTNCRMDAARVEFNKVGWKLDEWCPKPGMARHMGIAQHKYIGSSYIILHKAH